jgi:hypothetical protein
MATDIFVGSVSVGVVPDARGWNRDLERQLVPSADIVGREYGQKLGKTITDEMGKAGEKSGGAFGDSFRKRLEAAIKALPQAKIDGDTTEVDKKVEYLRLKLKELAESDIINSKDAMKQLGLIEAELKKVSGSAKGIDVRFNIETARAQLALLKREVDNTGGGGGRGGILGLIPGIGGGAGGAAGAAGTAGQAASGGGSLLTNPYVLVGGITAALVALPFLAQAAAGTITFALGGALAGIGLLGAGMDKSFQDTTKKIHGHTVTIAGDFTKFKDKAIADVKEIGSTMVPVLHNILDTTSGVLKALVPVFKASVAVIAGPLQTFVDTILKSFTRPEVQKSIYAISQAFADILNAFTPDIPGLFDSFAQAIERLAGAISKNPKAFADFLNFLFQIVIAVIDALAFLTIFVNYIEFHFVPAMKDIARIFGEVRHDVAHQWDLFWQDTIGNTIRAQRHLQALITSWLHDLAHWFDVARHDVSHIWDLMWNNTVGRAIRGYQDVVRIFINIRNGAVLWWHNIQNASASIWDTIWNNTVGRAIRGYQALMRVFTTLKNAVTSFFSGAVNWLVDAGKNIITGMFNGIKNAMAGIGGWIKANVVDPVVSHIKSFFGIKSPSQVMFAIGHNLIAGLLHGILSAGDLTHFIKNVFGGLPAALGSLVQKGLVNIARLPKKALDALGSVAGKIGGFFAKLFGGSVGGGVARWAGVVAQALSMLGLPLTLSKQVLYQMQTESGGNPNAINLTDINAQQGDPSRGLLQTIGSTFAAYHVPGTSNNIYDPLANVAAAINYAQHVYGPTLMRGGMGMGSGHGYDDGGWWPHGTFGWNMSGAPELVLTQDQLAGIKRGGDGGVAYHAHFDGLTGAAIESHVQTAFTAMSLTQGALNRNGRRS